MSEKKISKTETEGVKALVVSTIKSAPRSVWLSEEVENKILYAAREFDHEVGFMGMLTHYEQDDPEAIGYKVEDLILPKQTVSSTECDIDQEAWADLLTDEIILRKRQPHQFRCWIHTHPEGMAGPSCTDIENMEGYFSTGNTDSMVMLICTADGLWYGERWEMEYDKEGNGHTVRYRCLDDKVEQFEELSDWHTQIEKACSYKVLEPLKLSSKFHYGVSETVYDQYDSEAGELSNCVCDLCNDDKEPTIWLEVCPYCYDGLFSGGVTKEGIPF